VELIEAARCSLTPRFGKLFQGSLASDGDRWSFSMCQALSNQKVLVKQFKYNTSFCGVLMDS